MNSLQLYDASKTNILARDPFQHRSETVQSTAAHHVRCTATLRYSVIATVFVVLANWSHVAVQAEETYRQTIASVEPKLVKIYGSGGKRRLENYQSGFLISEDGYIITSRSYVLDSDSIDVVLHDGSRFQGERIGQDPILEIAVLKIEIDGADYFDLSEAVTLQPGERVLAFSNLFGVAVGAEPQSVLHGTVSAITELAASRGAFKSLYQGPIYILDAMTNNPGAAGGVITDRSGRLAAIIGKEMKSQNTGTWLNFAIPIREVVTTIEDIQAGRFIPRSRNGSKPRAPDPVTLELLGIILVPNIVANTPPYVDSVIPNSPAERAGVQPDDLIIFVNQRIMSSRQVLLDELPFLHRDDAATLTLQRGNEIFDFRYDPSLN